MQQVALITVHGMGETESSYANQLIKTLRNKLGSTAKQLHHDRVYYQEVLQYNEERVWQVTAHRLRWNKLRRFILFGFADAVGLEHRKEQKNSGYLFTQIKIARALYVAKQKLSPTGRGLFLAHSLGGHVLSCYLWDAASARG